MRQFKTKAISWFLILVMVLGVALPVNTWEVRAEENNQETESVSYTAKLAAVTSYLKKDNSTPAYGKEWIVMQQARAGQEDMKWYHTYYESVCQMVKENSETMYLSDYARTVIALTSIGADPTNVAGKNLLEPLADFDAIKEQYVTVAIYTLIALDSNNYNIPETSATNPTTRDKLITFIMENFNEDGYIGYEYKGTTYSDIDSTAMALQALAPYYNEEHSKVQTLVNKTLDYLSETQNDDGSFDSYADCCTTAQVLCALSALEIDGDADVKFIKNGNSVVDALLSYCQEDGGIYGAASWDKAMTCEQAAYALTAYDRLKNKGNSLYDMSDVSTKLYICEDENHVKTELQNVKEATCTSEGYTGDTVCSACGEKLAEGTVVAKKEHTPVKDAAVEATATTDGKTEGSHCGVCNQVLVAQQIIPATGQQATTNQQATTEEQNVEAPKKTSIAKLSSAKKKQIKITWKKKADVDGYQLQVSTSSKFKKSATKSYTVKSKKTTNKTVKSLKSKKKYYVRIRTYKTVTVNGKKVTKYSAWSGKKLIKVK